MDNSTRSAISRFSGLLLFLLTLLVVGVLIVLTIRAARDNNSQVSTDTVAVSGDASEGEDFLIDAEAEADNDTSGGITVDVSNESETTNGVVSVADDEQSSSTTIASVDAESSSEASDSDAVVAGASTTSAQLPEAGAGENALGAIFVTIAILAFVNSRKELRSSLR